MPEVGVRRKGGGSEAVLSGIWGGVGGCRGAQWRGAGGVLEMRFGKMWDLEELGGWSELGID